jgi:hypothetical protein
MRFHEVWIADTFLPAGGIVFMGWRSAGLLNPQATRLVAHGGVR